MTQTLLSKILELSKIDSQLARIASEKKKFQSELVLRKESLAKVQKEYQARQNAYEGKKTLYGKEEKYLKQERDKIADRRRGLGTHNNYKVQQAADKELDFLARQINLKEDGLINILTEIEELEKDASTWKEKLEALTATYQAYQKEAAETMPSLEERFLRFSTERQELVHGINPAQLTTYDRTRSRFAMDPVVPLNAQQACSGCHMNIGPQILVQIHRAENLVRCPGCNRILYLAANEAAASA